MIRSLLYCAMQCPDNEHWVIRSRGQSHGSSDTHQYVPTRGLMMLIALVDITTIVYDYKAVR